MHARRVLTSRQVAVFPPDVMMASGFRLDLRTETDVQMCQPETFDIER